MNFAHIIGEHQHGNFVDQTIHLIGSWGGLIFMIAAAFFVSLSIIVTTKVSPEKVNNK